MTKKCQMVQSLQLYPLNYMNLIVIIVLIESKKVLLEMIISKVVTRKSQTKWNEIMKFKEKLANLSRLKKLFILRNT